MGGGEAFRIVLRFLGKRSGERGEYSECLGVL